MAPKQTLILFSMYNYLFARQMCALLFCSGLFCSGLGEELLVCFIFGGGNIQTLNFIRGTIFNFKCERVHMAQVGVALYLTYAFGCCCSCCWMCESAPGNLVFWSCLACRDAKNNIEMWHINQVSRGRKYIKLRMRN